VKTHFDRQKESKAGKTSGEVQRLSWERKRKAVGRKSIRSKCEKEGVTHPHFLGGRRKGIKRTLRRRVFGVGGEEEKLEKKSSLRVGRTKIPEDIWRERFRVRNQSKKN